MQPKLCKTAWGRHLLYGAGLLALLVLLAPAGAGAVDLTVDGGATKFVPPSIAFDNEIIGDTGQGTLWQFAGSNTVTHDLTLGNTATGTGTYKLLPFGTLSVGTYEYIGNSGIGSFKQLGGTNMVGSTLYLGSESTGSGTYHLYNGNLSTEFDFIGYHGTGRFTQVGGSHEVSSLQVGVASSGNGTYNLDFGNLTAGSEFIGYAGPGSFIQAGGNNKVTDTLVLGFSAGSSGTYHMIGGHLQAPQEFIGYGFLGFLGSSIGSFSQLGGDHVVDTNLNLGFQSGGSGTYNLKFGNLAVGGDLTLGLQGTGTFNQWGGSLQVDGDEYLGILGPGIVNQDGGQHTVGKSLLVGQGGTGTYNLTGGKLTAGAIDISTNKGTFNVMNTITTVNANVAVDDGGRVNTTKAAVTWNGDFSIGINNGSYNSDHAQQTFTDLNVMGLGFLTAASQDVFSIKNDFNNQSANTTDWNTAAATLQFVKGDDKSHNFYIPGADNGPSSTNAFAWHTLNIFGQTVHLLDGDPFNSTAYSDGAQYVKVLLGADVNWATKVVNNIFNDDPNNATLNIYYDPKELANFYLLGLDYTFANGHGMLIADAAAPLPPSVFLLGSGLLGLGLLGWRRKRLMG